MSHSGHSARAIIQVQKGAPAKWHIFVILIVSCISVIVAPSNLCIIGPIGTEV